ncbi:uncharacterized protein LOC113850857 [Abrus precatorius]|uniref:Uncharacterized protein LOC113850857 n=1 Tax=Abrus precatorius TaxID=3816 RepID=A0A8B8K2D7_ABRPR|nr:uncharacterized protein LOC113850857 [Abrus precatorius]
MGFGERWAKWMEACIYGGHLSVLVNGCPTKEVEIGRGLKQGLGSLMRSAVAKDFFKRIKVGEGPEISLLQFADDMLLIGEATERNLWTIKVGTLPFRYLGLYVGDKLRHKVAWERLLEKMPPSIVKEVVKIQRRFLWSEVKEFSTICWVKWDQVCKPIKEGGLGIKKDVAWVCQQANFWVDISLNCVIGDSSTMRFWVDKWVRDVALAEIFPRLFFVPANKESKISENGRFVEGVWMWNFQWRRQIIFSKRGNDSQIDRAHWWSFANDMVLALRHMWKALVPKKASVFSWQLLLQTLPIRKELVNRGMLLINESCALCNHDDEEMKHLFLHCSISSSIWWEKEVEVCSNYLDSHDMELLVT